MSLIAEQLLEKFGEVQNGWVVLVGDGKTYKHLMNIKRQYIQYSTTKTVNFPWGWAHIKEPPAYFKGRETCKKSFSNSCIKWLIEW